MSGRQTQVGIYNTRWKNPEAELKSRAIKQEVKGKDRIINKASIFWSLRL